jgi:hypothetical protein
VTGLPTNGVRPGQYGRDIALEMLSESPYCPFRADIWQLGKVQVNFGGLFAVVTFGMPTQHLGSLSPSLIELFDVMCSDDPLSRPSASGLLEHI